MNLPVDLAAASPEDFTHLKLHKRLNLQYDWYRVAGSFCTSLSWKVDSAKPPTPTTSGYAQPGDETRY